MIRKVLLCCGVASSVLYIVGDILASLRYPGYRYTDYTLSELMAAGAPTRGLLIVLFIPYNLLAVAFGVGIWVSASPRRAARATGAMLGVYGAAGLAGLLLFRMNTRAVLAAGGGDWRNAMHPVVTVAISLVLVLIMAVGSRLLSKRFRYYTYGTILALIVFGMLTSLQTGRMVANQPTPWMGLEERVCAYVPMLWFVALAIGLLRTATVQPEAAARTSVAAPSARALTPSAGGGTH